MAAFGMLFFTSCSNDDDGYSLGDFWLSSGTVTKDAESFHITTDDGTILWPSATAVDPSFLEDGMRVIVNYTILGDADDDERYDHYVKVNRITEILTKPVFKFTEETTQEVIDSIGHDPVTIIDTWFTDDYLNVEFEYGGGGGIHFINLVHNSEESETDEGEVILELKHNKNGDPYNVRQWGIASFDVSSFKSDESNSIDFFVRSMGKDGEYEYNEVLTYTYDELDMPQTNAVKLHHDYNETGLIK